jgi:phage tail tube protein FII
MKTTLVLLIFLCCTAIAFAQKELKGTWVLESYTVDGRKPTEIQDRLEKVKITFGGEGRYVKRYHEEDLPDGARIEMTYKFPEGKITKKYFDKDGYELKVVRVVKKIDNGTYEKTDSDKLRISTAKGNYTKMFNMNGQYLSIADTLNNRVVWSRYKRRS